MLYVRRDKFSWMTSYSLKQQKLHPSKIFTYVVSATYIDPFGSNL